MSRKDDIEKLITNHKLRLQKLKEQKTLEDISADPKILIEIEKLEAEIEELETGLKKSLRLVGQNPLRLLPIIIFVLVIFGVGYLIVKGDLASSDTSMPVVETSSPTSTPVTTEEATAVAAKTVAAEANATATAKAAEVAQTATTTANQTATTAAEQATAKASAATAAQATEIVAQTAATEANQTATVAAQTATTAANQTTTAVAEKAEAEASATAEAKTTEVAQTATAEANQAATAAAQTATAEANATATAKALTPTATPTPKSDAIVIDPNGVELREGPNKDKYGLIDMLPKDTSLNNLRPVVRNDAWMQAMAAKPDVSEPITGYVTTAPGSVQLNVQLDDFPPIYEFGPALLEPKWGETRSTGAPITFKWQEDYAVLEEHQFYSLILVLDDHPLGDEGACYHWQTKETKMDVNPEEHRCGGGLYHWGVGIATDLTKGVGDERKWRDDSERDERFPIGLDIPHPERPPDEGGGGVEEDSGHLPPDL